MNTAVVNIKVEPNIKKEAQKVAKDLGLSLSSLINAYLKQLVRSKRVILTLEEEPTDYLLNALRESKENIKKGRVSPTFEKAEDAIFWLRNPKKKYAGQI